MRQPEENPNSNTEEVEETHQPQPKPRMSTRHRVIAVLVMLAGPLMLVVLIVGTAVAGTYTAGQRQQDEIMAAHTRAVQLLGNCKDELAKAAFLAPTDADAADTPLTQAVAGGFGIGSQLRYTDMLVALNENVTVPHKADAVEVALTVAICQDRFLQAQQSVADLVAKFKEWRTRDWHMLHLGASGFPKDDLKLSLPGRCVRGKEALGLLERPVADLAIETRWDVADPQHTACK